MDPDLLKVTCEVAKQITKDVYKDIVKPIAEPTGKILALAPSTILTLLNPLRKWILYDEYNFKETALLLAKKLENIDPEKIVSPEPYIAVPALQQISYSMDNEELRNMYANLLAKAMNIDTKGTVHPSFVGIIKQLSPDEALLLKYIYTDKLNQAYRGAIPTITLIGINEKEDYDICIDKFSDYPERAGCALQPYAKIYFDNFNRLGILESTGLTVSIDNYYKELIEHTYMYNYIEMMTKQGMYSRDKIDFKKNSYQVTDYGMRFCQTCVAD